jgi:hypothetical protein
MREVDHVEKAEDQRKAEAQKRVEGAVDKAEKQLAQQNTRGNSEYLRHAAFYLLTPVASDGSFGD